MKAIALALVAALTAISPPSALGSTPTNNAAAFRIFNLYSDRTYVYGAGDHQTVGGYPATLSSDALIVTRTVGGVPDTVALINSKPYDFIRLTTAASPTLTAVEYAVVPPQYATSLGIIMDGEFLFGFGDRPDFDDTNKWLGSLWVTFDDSSQLHFDIRVTKRIRNFLYTFQTCADTLIFTDCTRATNYTNTGVLSDTGAVVLYSGGGLKYDFFACPLSVALPKKVTKIRLETQTVDHLCCNAVPHIYAGIHFHGLSIWPRFSVANTDSQPVVRQSQTTGHDHGGYLFGNTVVGTRRTTDVSACQVASMAMAYTYAGFPCTVDSLNAHLQRSRGYEPDRAAVVTFVSPTGDAIRFTATGKTALKVNDLFLVEHGTYTTPLATYRVTVAGRNGQATRAAIHSATIPSVGDPGRVYWKMIPRVADSYTHNPQLHSIDLYDSPQLAAQVESLLVRNIAVQLNVPGHFVVADGWTSSFRPGGSARGTYSIKDPYDPRNYTKLIQGKYRNTFAMARYVVPTGLGPLTAPFAATTGPAGLNILASGARRVEVIDPLGRHMLRDAGTGEGVYEIPDASIEDVSSEHDNGGDVDDPLTGYDLQIPTTVDGHYTVRVYADDGLSMSASGYDASGVFASDAATDTTVGATGTSYDVLYSGAGQTVVVTSLGALGVGVTPPGPTQLGVRRNPTTGPVEFVITRAAGSGDNVEIFDISGRKVDLLQVAAGGPGTQTVTWDWRQSACRPGVYLARLRSRGDQVTRFVVLH